MLKATTNLAPSELSPIPTDEPSVAETIARGLGIVRRQIFAVSAFALLGLALGGIFFAKTPPKYIATATLLVDTRKMELVQQPAVYNDMSIQSMGAMESQVELLKSDEVALNVIRKLNLSEDPRFIGGGREGALQSLLYRVAPSYFRETPALSEDERQNLTLKLFTKNLSVTRIGVTYAMEINFESRYPDLAAKVANAVAGAYIDLQRTTEYEAARRASDWLEQRIPELRAKSEDAQKAVVDYKQEHNIVETDGGRLVDEQRLTGMNDQLNAAHDETLKAKARFNQFSVAKGIEIPSTAAIGSDAHAASPDFLDKLRSQYLDVVSKEADSSAKLGPNNPAIISLRNQKIQLRSEIAEEIQHLNLELAKRSKELEGTNKELEAFAYSISHDLRAPLRHMVGFTELLQKNAASTLDDKGRRYMMIILESAKRMGTLIDDLLVFSRIGRAETRETIVSLDRLESLFAFLWLRSDKLRSQSPVTLHPKPLVRTAWS